MKSLCVPPAYLASLGTGCGGERRSKSACIGAGANGPFRLCLRACDREGPAVDAQIVRSLKGWPNLRSLCHSAFFSYFLWRMRRLTRQRWAGGGEASCCTSLLHPRPASRFTEATPLLTCLLTLDGVQEQSTAASFFSAHSPLPRQLFSCTPTAVSISSTCPMNPLSNDTTPPTCLMNPPTAL